MENVAGSLQLEINNQCFILKLNEVYLLGKQLNNNTIGINCPNVIWLKNEQLDNKHCLLEVTRNGHVFFTDLCSTAGICVNGTRLPTLQRVSVHYDDNIKLGDQVGKLSQNKICELDSSGFLDSNKSLSKNNSNSLDMEELLVNSTNINTSDNSNIIIPETQFFNEQASYNNNSLHQNKSSLKDNLIEEGKGGISLTKLDTTFHDCCIPETQEISPQKYDTSTRAYNNNNANIQNGLHELQQNVHNMSLKKFLNENIQTITPIAKVATASSFTVTTSIAANSTVTNAKDIINSESQFRICTQDFSADSDENEMVQDVQSQVSSIIINVNSNNVSHANTADVKLELIEEKQKEQRVEESLLKMDTELKQEIRNHTVTPELDDHILDNSIEIEDFLETQKYTNFDKNTKITTFQNILSNTPFSESNGKNKATRKEHSKENGFLNKHEIMFVGSNLKNGNDEIDEDDILTQKFLKPTASKNLNSDDELSNCSTTKTTTNKIQDSCYSAMLDYANNINSGKQFNDVDAVAPIASKLDEEIEALNTIATPIIDTSPIEITVDSDNEFIPSIPSTPEIIKKYINIDDIKHFNKNSLTGQGASWVISNKDDNAIEQNSTIMKHDHVDDSKHNHIHDIQNHNTEEKIVERSIFKEKPKQLQLNLKKKVVVKLHKIDCVNSNSSLKQNGGAKELLNQKNRNEVLTSTIITRRRLHSSRVINTSEDNIPTQPLEPRTRTRNLKTSKNTTKGPTTNPKELQSKKGKVSSMDTKVEKNYLKCSKNEKIVEEKDTDQDFLCTQPFPTISVLKSSSNNNTTKDSTVNTNESKSRRKREASSSIDANVKTKYSKRLKNEDTIELSDTDNDSIRTQPLLTISSLSKSRKLLISTTMVDPKVLENLYKDSRDYWCVASDPMNSEILIMDKSIRTYKFLLAMAKGTPIVTSKWLRKVNNNQCLMLFEDDLVYDRSFEKCHKFSILKSLKKVMYREKPLFYGYEFALTSSILPTPEYTKNLIEVSGGKVHTDRKVREANINKLYLVSCIADKRHWHTYRRLCNTLFIISTEAIMSAIMQQSVEPFAKHLLH